MTALKFVTKRRLNFLDAMLIGALSVAAHNSDWLAALAILVIGSAISVFAEKIADSAS